MPFGGTHTDLEKSDDKTFIGKIDRGFDFLGFRFSREGRRLAEKTVRKFAKNIVQKLETCKTGDTGKITPVIPVGKRRSGSAFGTWRFQDKNEKGDLPVPETVSAYIRRWFIWVKSVYGKETQIFGSSTVVYRELPRNAV